MTKNRVEDKGKEVTTIIHVTKTGERYRKSGHKNDSCDRKRYKKWA